MELTSLQPLRLFFFFSSAEERPRVSHTQGKCFPGFAESVGEEPSPTPTPSDIAELADLEMATCPAQEGQVSEKEANMKKAGSSRESFALVTWSPRPGLKFTQFHGQQCVYLLVFFSLTLSFKGRNV